jgi:cytosine/adenosine deaminase-related metal-dependent hydrolase
MQRSHFSALTLINADMRGGLATLRLQGSRIAAVGAGAQPGDRVIDLHGDRVLPGLINAHDHLQLNSFARSEYRGPYRNAREWIADVNERMRVDRAFKASATGSRAERLLMGGIKNLLSGVTTVAHHDPFYPILRSSQFPTRVVTDFGWSHSLYIDGEERVRHSYAQTPIEWPWIVHAAEGLDADAAGEFEQLDALGCLGPNTLIVHGVALDRAQRRRLDDAAAGLIWCPRSNFTLFGTTADVADLISRGRVALGTDSRLTGARDLLEELRIAREFARLDECSLESLVTADSARLLHLADRGVLKVGACADILILPAAMPLSGATRADLRLVMLGGRVCYADKDYAMLLAPEAQWVDVRVDGRPKVLERALATILRNAGGTEEGLELTDPAWRAA